MGAAPVMEYMFLFPNGVGPDRLRNAPWVFMTLEEAVKKGLLNAQGMFFFSPATSSLTSSMLMMSRPSG
jgi:hypothetical protein